MDLFYCFQELMAHNVSFFVAKIVAFFIVDLDFLNTVSNIF